MEVILLESFDKLGKVGDVVRVKNGFARNYLIPRKKALRANTANREHFEKIKKDLIKKNDETILNAKNLVDKIENDEIIFIRNAADNGQLYGSVTPKDISQYFIDKKIDIQPSSINLHSAIKKTGLFEINVRLHADVSCKLEINVATSAENAKSQKKEKDNVDKKDVSIEKNQESQDNSNSLTSQSSDTKNNEDEDLSTEVKEKKVEKNKGVF